MRIPKALAASVLPLFLLTVACNDDASVDAGAVDEAPEDPDCQADCDDIAVTVPDRAADLVGTITSVTPFVPITEDCTPPEDVDPDSAISSDDPPICTAEDNDLLGTILVEEDPDSPDSGRKVSFTVTTDSAIAGVPAFDDLAAGQAVDTWISGNACAESYPEQCGLEAIDVTG